MSELDRLETENLVVVHRARDEWEANIIVGYLRDCGLEASNQAHAIQSKSGTCPGFEGPVTGCDVLVLEHCFDQARDAVATFTSAVADPQLLEEAAAKKLRLTKETITELRAALREENETFRLLGWLVAAFFVSASLLWAILPSWLSSGLPFGVMRWVTVCMLMVAALLVGRLVGRMSRSS
jgi:hypothetical protein